MTDLPSLDTIADAPLSVVLLACPGSTSADSIVETWVRYLRNRLAPQATVQRDELIIVHDGTFNGVHELVARLSPFNPLIALQIIEQKEGVGRMVRDGLAQATRPLVLLVPCSAAYKPDMVKGLFGIIDQVHLVSGYRAGWPVPPLLRWLGRLFRVLAGVAVGMWPQPLPGWLGWRGHRARWVARLFFGVHTLDVGCPLRLMRREVLWRSPIQSRGTFALVELLAKVNFQGCLIAEDVPIPVGPGQEGLPLSSAKETWRDGLRLFQHPDFGPVSKPELQPPGAIAEPNPPPAPTANTGIV